MGVRLLNFLVGSHVDAGGCAHILTTPGAAGHAVHGDYLDHPPGFYAVEFHIAPVAGQVFRPDRHCAEIDVVVGNDTVVLARRDIRLSDLRGGPSRFVLRFRLDAPGRLQFRVAVNGVAPLLIADERPLARLPDDGADATALLAAARFPDPMAAGAPAFLVEQAATLRQLFDRGIGVAVKDGDVVLSAEGVSFLARTPDDLSFVGEVFLDNIYNIAMAGDACVIDIGMNMGLVTLMMAGRPWVKAVHAFEPFPDTYRRACANIAINPELAGKIHVHPVGLSDRDEAGRFVVPDMGCSGAMTIRRIGHGIPVDLTIRDAATLLGPIIADAVARGLRIVMKVDCEGSEFPVFATLEKAGLLEKVSAFMVEWHRVVDDANQATLMAPLLRHGFATFDRSPRTGNGFFYAVRMDAKG